MTEPGIAAPRRLTYVRLADLRPNLLNPKAHDVEAILDSFRRHGWTVPILVCERTQTIAAGHGRLAACITAKERGEAPPEGVLVDNDGEWLLPVSRGWSSKDDADLKAYLIRDNRLPLLGGWDDFKLAPMLEEIHAADADLFDSLKFDVDELEDLFSALEPPGEASAAADATEGGEDLDDDGEVDAEDDNAVDGPDPDPTITCPNCKHAWSPGR